MDESSSLRPLEESHMRGGADGCAMEMRQFPLQSRKRRRNGEFGMSSGLFPRLLVNCRFGEKRMVAVIIV